MRTPPLNEDTSFNQDTFFKGICYREVHLVHITYLGQPCVQAPTALQAPHLNTQEDVSNIMAGYYLFL